MNGRHVIAPFGDGGVVGDASAADGPVEQPLVEDGEGEIAVVAVVEGLLRQCFDFGEVALDADIAAAVVEGVEGGVILWVFNLREGKGFWGEAAPMMIDNAADVDQIVKVGGVAVGHDLGAIGGDEGGAEGQVGRVDGGVERFLVVEGTGGAVQLLVPLFLGEIEGGGNGRPVGAVGFERF